MRKASILIVLVLIFSMFSATVSAEQGESIMDFESLSALCETYGFTLGTVINPSIISDKTQSELILTEFNSVTFANEAKAYSLLNQSMCKSSPDGMPRMNFHTADKMMDWCQNNGLHVRGHVLVWDAYMPDWFFREYYMNNTPFVDTETMKLRVQSYIEQVITHFEENYPGVIYCWDVVNEAVGDNASEWNPGDSRHLRTIRSGTSNLFRDVIGEDYVEYAFLCAHDTVQKLGADIKLFYNDYNAFDTNKSNAIVALVNSINTYAVDADGLPVKLIDGVGMQGYIGGYGSQNGCLNMNDIEKIRSCILKYADLGCEVHITEMALRCYEPGDAWMQKHADFYAAMFKMLTSINTDTSSPLTNVSIWGLFDCEYLPTSNYTWKLNSPYGGLFTSGCAIKPAFRSVYQVLKGE